MSGVEHWVVNFKIDMPEMTSLMIYILYMGNIWQTIQVKAIGEDKFGE